VNGARKTIEETRMTVMRQLNEVRRYAAAAVERFAGRWNERRAINRLSGYPDAMLKDIGISRGELPFVVRCSRDRDLPRRKPAFPARLRQEGNVVPFRPATVAGVSKASDVAPSSFETVPPTRPEEHAVA
jgi:uncharacterized protein YjiS (DUF1127 family)